MALPIACVNRLTVLRLGLRHKRTVAADPNPGSAAYKDEVLGGVQQELNVKRFSQMVIIMYSCFAMLGCMTTQPLTAGRAQLSQTLHPHDRVEVVTRAGQTLKFKVETIDDAGLHGAGQNVAFDDIESISREKIDAGRTSLIALGVAAVAAVAVGGGGGGGSGY